jgi:hypothetical protein
MSDYGKGSKDRVKNLKQFGKNYDAIFGKKPKTWAESDFHELYEKFEKFHKSLKPDANI